LADFIKRSPRLWIGLAAASLAIIACLCGLALIATLAGYRARGSVLPAATLVPDQPGVSLTLSPPAKPIVQPTTLSGVRDNWPIADVPMPAEADLGTLIGSPDSFSVITDQEFDEVLAFYQTEMEAQGWSKVDYGTRITEGDAELHYRKDEINVTVILARIPFVGTLVEIRLQPA
jgi:hypothetical protein